jgi:hypothetical protein
MDAAKKILNILGSSIKQKTRLVTNRPGDFLPMGDLTGQKCELDMTNQNKSHA